VNFRKMKLNLKKFCPDLSVPVIAERINDRYQDIIRKEDWEFLRDSLTLRLYEQVTNASTESCAVTQGSTTVTGSSTTWSDDDLIDTGWMFRVGSNKQPYIVSSVTDNTTIVLEAAYAEDDATSQDFTAQKTMYSISNANEILRIKHDNDVTEVSRLYLDRIDPQRDSTGEPQHYAVFSKSKATGVITFEIWPIPDSDYTVTVEFKKTVSDLSSDDDEPVFDSQVLEAGALWDCYRLTYVITQNPAFVGLARDARKDYNDAIRDLVLEDLRTASLPRRVLDVSEPRVWDNNYWTRHDVD